MNDQPTEAPPPVSPGASPNETKKGKKAKAPPLEPTLASYFGLKPIPLAPFFKAVHAAKVERFASDDLAAAAAAAADMDASGERLLALAAQPGKPKAVDRWIWLAVQSFLKARIPAAFQTPLGDADVTLRQIYRELEHSLSDANADRQKQARLQFAMSLTWLANQRQLNIPVALALIRNSFPCSDIESRELTRKALAEGRVGTLRRLAAIVALLDGAARDTRAALEAERQRRAAVETDLRDARAVVAQLTAQVNELTQERKNAAAEADDAKRKLAESRQHAGHDIVELKARHSAFLRRRIAPLLSDAVDALEIEPPAPQIAIGRLKSAIDAIGDSTE